MQQLTPQDAVFLSIETPELPAHIGGLAFLDPTPSQTPASDDSTGTVSFSYNNFVEFIRNRLTPIDRFSWRLQEVPFGLDRPYWVRGADFRPDEHLHQERIPEPYSPEALSKLVGRLFERPLDRSRPLWDMVLIEGLPGGRYVLLWRMHHCLMDGASGANLVEQLFDLTPNAVREAPVRIEDGALAGKPLTARKILKRAVRNAAGLPRIQSKFIGQALSALMSREPANSEVGTGPAKKAPSALAPPAPFNGVVGMHRGLAWSTISLDDVKRIKSTLGVTVNDIVLAVTSGAMRSYLESKGQLPSESLVASVPCSMRTGNDTSLGNQIREMPIRWSTDIEDPIKRVAAINASAKEAKAAAKSGNSFDMIGAMSEALLPGALNLFIRAAAAAGDKMPLPANAVVSNVAMAPIPLYCAGARIEQVVPISLLAPTQGLNITVLSYCGELHFGIVHDPALMPDAWDLAGRIPKNLQSLQLAVDRALAQESIDIRE